MGAADGCGFGKGQDSCFLLLRSSNPLHMRLIGSFRSEHSARLQGSRAGRRLSARDLGHVNGDVPKDPAGTGVLANRQAVAHA
jgi:hypothetical protein